MSAYPSQFASGLHRVFLKPGCILRYIPCGRSARKSTSPDTVLKRAQKLYLMLKHLKY